jgi:hypothetical protein
LKDHPALMEELRAKLLSANGIGNLLIEKADALEGEAEVAVAPAKKGKTH